MPIYHCYRCSGCGTNWPYVSIYRECPQCRTPTAHFSDVKESDVLDEDEAQILSRYYNFEYYYETEHNPSNDLDPDLEARIENHIHEVNRAHQEGKDYVKNDDFEALIDGQFDDEMRFRITEIERIMRGNERYKDLLESSDTSDEQ